MHGAQLQPVHVVLERNGAGTDHHKASDRISD
jgi:hypothetical protein